MNTYPTTHQATFRLLGAAGLLTATQTAAINGFSDLEFCYFVSKMAKKYPKIDGELYTMKNELISDIIMRSMQKTIKGNFISILGGMVSAKPRLNITTKLLGRAEMQPVHPGFVCKQTKNPILIYNLPKNEYSKK